MKRTIFKNMVKPKTSTKPRNGRSYTQKELIQAMRRDVQIWNRNWSKAVIRSFNVVGLLARVSPIYRDEYEYWAKELKML